MIPFGGTSEMRDQLRTPPAIDEENTSIRLLTPEEFNAEIDAAIHLEHREPLLTEDEIEDILAMIVGVIAGEIAVEAVTGPLPGGMVKALKTRRVEDLKLELIGDGAAEVVLGSSVEEIAAAYFRIWWRARDDRDQLARFMAEAGVDPERIEVDPDAIYRGTPGYMDLWVDLLDITRQQHIIAKVRERGAYVPSLWLDEQIRDAKDARQKVYETAGLELPKEPELTDAQRDARAKLGVWRENLESAE